MSFWDELKKPLYQLVAQDSRNAAWLGNAIGWKYLEDEANRNVQNPGRAIGKAAAAAASWYLGGAAAGAGGAAGEGGAAAADTAAGAVPLSGAFASGANIGSMTQEQLAQEAILRAMADQGGGSLLASAPQSGLMQSSLLNPAPGVVAPGQGFGAAVENSLINNGYGQAASYLNQASGLLGGGSKGASGLLAAKQGIDMMSPHPPPPAPPQRAMGQSQPVEPLPLPYGTPSGNSLGMGMPMTEDQKRRLRALGYRI